MTDLERIARAIMPDAWHETARPDGSKYYTLVCADEEQSRAIRYIRAALLEMREPSEAQYEALSELGKMWRELNSTTVWQTYIDAILNEKTP